MEQVKVYDTFLEQLSNFKTLNEDEKKNLIREIASVLLSEQELFELALSFYTPYSAVDLDLDAKKLKTKMELKKAILIDTEDKEIRTLEQQKLELEKIRIQSEMQQLNLNIINQNQNNASSNICVTFDKVKDAIESMTSLSEVEINEIKNKIDEIETIVNSNESKSKKWVKAKDIIKWVADKGVDVGIALLPLILKIS